MQLAKSLKTGLVSTLAILMATEAFAVEAMPITELNVRSGPGPRFAVLDRLYQGEVVDVTECEGSGWCMVYHDGPDGWVSARYLSQVSAGDLPPIVDDYPQQQDYPPPQPDTSSDGAEAAAGLAFLAILGLSAAAIAGGMAQDNANPPPPPNNPPHFPLPGNQPHPNPPSAWQGCPPGTFWSMRAHRCVAN